MPAAHILRRWLRTILAPLLLFSPLLGPALPTLAAGSISLTALDAPVSENFGTLALSGTSSITPNGWALSETGTNANTTYSTGTGSSTTGDTYSFGASGSTERAFGGLQSGSLVPTIGVSFTNNTGGTITQLAIGYTGEQWRLGSTGRVDRLDFQYSINATSPASGTFVDVDALDFTAPVSAGTVGALDGNAAANRTARSATISGLNLANGAVFWLRWVDLNAAGSDDGLAIDDFTLTPSGTTATAPSITSQPQSQTIASSQSATLSVLANGTAPLSYQWYQGNSGNTAALVGTNSASFTTPALTATTSYWVRVSNSAGSADSATATVTVGVAGACSAPDITIGSAQGSTEISPLSGTSVTVQGVVVGDFEGVSPALRGFYMQDSGDGNSATSDGIFVFESDSANRVSAGDEVQVTGTIGENQGQTQITLTAFESCGAGSVAPTDLNMPFASATALEAVEGMLVRFPQALYVTEHFQLARFGQVVVSSGSRLRQPTNVAAPGAPALAVQAQNDLNRLIVDDDNQTQNPDPIQFGRGGSPLSAGNTLRGGDSVAGMVGVLTYTWSGNAASGNAYRLRPIGALGGGAPNFQPANARPASPSPVGGRIRVTAANVLNYFNTFGLGACTGGVGGAATDCRGAENQTEFDRQWLKTVAAIVGGGADVVGIMEIENDGYGASSAIQDLVTKLNNASAPGTYAFINADSGTGQTNALGSDAIKVALIYKPAKVAPVGTTAVLNSTAFVNGGDGAARNRPALTQAFQEVATGARFIVSVNHLKSKGSACDTPDTGDGQGNCNVVRTNAANTLLSWLAGNPTGTGDPDVMIVGDLNSYAQEDPIMAIKSAGYSNLIETLVGADAYSYAFDGQWGYLDHALATASLAGQVAGVTEWHINADEPTAIDYNTNFKSAGQITGLYSADQYRSSDHDPVIVGLNLAAANTPPVANGQSVSTAEDTALGITLSGSDAEGNPLTYSIVAGPSHGTLSGTGASRTYTPAANYSGADSFTFKVNDGTADSNIATVSINVTPVNDAPLAVNDSASVRKNRTSTITVLTNDSDPDGNALTVTAVTQPANGTVSINANGSIQFTPRSNFTGTTSFTYTISDGQGGSATATVTVTVR